MSVNNVSQYAYGLSFWQTQQTAADGTKSTNWASEKAKTEGQTSSSANRNGYSTQTDMISSLTAAIKSAMNGLGLKDGERVTFNTLSAAREKMEAAFSSQVKEDLKKLEVDEDVQFKLVTDTNGGVKVLCDHADKAKIEKYFKDNPKMVEKFKEIQSLSNVEEARKSGGFDPATVRNRIQIESMVAWYAGSGQSVQELMQYSGGNTAFSAAGINRVA